MPQGTVKKVISEKGFGFIEREGYDDLFFHIKNNKGVPEEQLVKGLQVTFEIGKSAKGEVAVGLSV